MSANRRFMQMDVFSRQPMRGNPLAVVIDGEGLDEADMRAFARWTNLSETAFLLPPTAPHADYRVRIFTPRQELPFAGHPSVGSAYAAIDAGIVTAGKTQLIQQCAAGLLAVRVEGRGSERIIHVQAPPARLVSLPADVHRQIAAAVCMKVDDSQPDMIQNGPRWWLCDLKEASRVRSLKPDLHAIQRLCEEHAAIGVAVFGREHDPRAQMAVRAFCPADGIPEDPVTGSANAAIMALLAARNDPRYGASYVASQGREIDRDGYVTVTRDVVSGAVAIGGQCVTLIRGQLEL